MAFLEAQPVVLTVRIKLVLNCLGFLAGDVYFIIEVLFPLM